MLCNQCGKDIKDCLCEDADKRLKEVYFNHFAPLATKWCRSCDKHCKRCKCRKPDLFVVSGGRELDT